MSKKTSLGLLAATVLILVVGYVALERSTRPAPAPDALPPAVDASTPSSVPRFSASPTNSASSPESSSGALDTERTETRAPGEPLFPPENPLPSVDDLLAEDNDDLPNVARKLAFLVAVPALPLEERENALAHALNLAAGNEPQIIDPLVANPQVADSLAEVILSEALNRSLSEQADLYLSALANRKSEALQTLIREHLAFLTDSEDLGPDPAAWQTAVSNAKKEWAN